MLTCEIAALSTPAGIEARLKSFGIDLGRPVAVERLDELERATSQGAGSGTRGEQEQGVVAVTPPRLRIGE